MDRARLQAMLNSARPHVRVLFVLFHAAMVVLMSMPRTAKLSDREAWQHERVQANFGRAAQVVNSVGLDQSSEQLQDVAFAAITGYLHFLDAAQVPFGPYMKFGSLRQSWRMFLAGKADTSRLRMEVYEDGAYRTVYERGSDVHTWQRRLMSLHRMRKISSYTKSRKGDIKDLGRWLAPRAARDFPKASRLRVSQRRYTVPTPAQLRKGEVSPITAGHVSRRMLERYR